LIEGRDVLNRLLLTSDSRSEVHHVLKASFLQIVVF